MGPRPLPGLDLQGQAGLSRRTPPAATQKALEIILVNGNDQMGGSPRPATANSTSDPGPGHNPAPRVILCDVPARPVSGGHPDQLPVLQNLIWSVGSATRSPSIARFRHTRRETLHTL